jgi:hypothetical protein
MEVHVGLGTLQEFRAERWLREAVILAIWEGPSDRQILDGLEVMERKRAHHLLLQLLSANVPASALQIWKQGSNDTLPTSLGKKRQEPRRGLT